MARRPESVLVVVYTEDRQCLLLRRVAPAGFWQSVTGALRWDETPAQAAARELAEETGLDAAGLRDAGYSNRFSILPEWRAKYAPDVSENIEHVFHLKLGAPLAVNLNPAEHSAQLWLPIAAAMAKVSSSTNRDALARLVD